MLAVLTSIIHKDPGMKSTAFKLNVCAALITGLCMTPVLGAETADTVFINGKITTLDAKRPQASAVAIKDGVFIAVGSNARIRRYATTETPVVDLKGKRVVPGLIDAHTHPVETLWLSEDWVDGRYPDVPSVAKTLENIAERVKTTPKGEWIYVACVSASENKFIEKRLPNLAELDKAAPDNPLVLANGAHMNVVNSRTLEYLHISKGNTHLPKGGTVLVDADGNPTGVIADGFASLPGSPSPGEIARYYVTDIPALWNRQGFTSLLAITPVTVLPLLQRASLERAEPNIRYTVSAWASPDGDGLAQDLNVYEMPAQANPNYYRFAGVKAWVDGENDCRTGWMYQPYEGHFDSDPAGGRGTLVTPQDKANRFVNLAHSSHRLSMLHCSGDAAMDIGLNAYEQSIAQNAMPKTIRRIEHFGMFQMSSTQLARAKKLKKDGLHISSQPIWLLELVKADYENMGIQRTKSGFKFKTMINAGLEPAASTDMTGIYLGNINPYRAMYALVTRQSDAGVFEPQEAITVDQALRMWTIWPAKAIGESEHRGTIEVGKLADMTVLSDDIYAIPKAQLKDVQADRTIVGGKVVYTRQP